MRDEFYRNMCDNPTEYDKVIDWIATNNLSGANTWNETGEEFACRAVHSCIRTVVFTDNKPMYCSTGMCLAVRASSNPDLPGYNKVRLAISL